MLPPTDPDTELYRRVVERVRGMSHEQRVELMKRAGVLNEDGKLAERYRPPEPSPDDQPAPAAES